MDLGVSDGGLPPDELVEDLDAVLAETERLAAALHGRGTEPRPARRRTLLAVLRHRPADGGVGGARAAARVAAPHAPRRDGRGGGLLPRALRLPPGRVPRAPRLARGRRVVCPLRPPLGARHRALRRDGAGVAHCPTSNLRLGAGVAPVRDLVDAGVRVGLGVDGSASNERSDLFFEVKQALLVARGRGGRAAMTAREALRLGTRGGAACFAATTSARSSPASAPTSPSGAPTGSSSAAPPTPSRAWSSPGRIASTGCSSVASRWCGGRLVHADEVEIATRPPPSGRTFSVDDLSSRPTSSTPGPGARPPGSTSSSGTAPSSIGQGATDADGRSRASPTRARPLPARLPPALAVLPPRRARGRARRRAPPRACCSSPRTRARATAAAERRGARGALRGTHPVRRAAGRARRPARQARQRRRRLTDEEKREVLDAHPAIGQRSSPPGSAAEQGSAAIPRCGGARPPERRYEERPAFASSSSSTGARRRDPAVLRERLERTRDAGARDGARRARRDRDRSLAARMTVVAAVLDPYITDWLNLLSAGCT